VAGTDDKVSRPFHDRERYLFCTPHVRAAESPGAGRMGKGIPFPATAGIGPEGRFRKSYEDLQPEEGTINSPVVFHVMRVFCSDHDGWLGIVFLYLRDQVTIGGSLVTSFSVQTNTE